MYCSKHLNAISEPRSVLLSMCFSQTIDYLRLTNVYLSSPMAIAQNIKEEFLLKVKPEKAILPICS
jgi:hypothetical protein